MTPFIKTVVTAVGGLVAAVASALCCAGPLVAIAFGVSGAGMAGTFEPPRPYFLGAAGVFLAGGFVLVHREERKACEPGKPCAKPLVRRRTVKLFCSGKELVYSVQGLPIAGGKKVMDAVEKLVRDEVGVPPGTTCWRPYASDKDAGARDGLPRSRESG